MHFIYNVKMKWAIQLIAILDVIQFVIGCTRLPEGTTAEKSPSDGRFIIKITGASDKYEPGQKYNVTLMGIQEAASSAHTFEKFYLTVQSETDPLGTSDPKSVGNFALINTDTTKFSGDCPNLITQTNNAAKTKVQVEWTAPDRGNGCVLMRATVIERDDIWYMDDGSLTKQLCEMEEDDIDNEPPVEDPCCACDEAKYELIFEGMWSRHTHPKDFPADNWRTGFSDIIGASHTIDYRFWKFGELASEGLREVAEHGSTRTLEGELKEQSDQIRTIIKARGLSHPNVTGKTFAVFRVDSKHHLISLVSMIQPSPDWIVGVSGLELCLPNCTWIEHKIHNLFPWDAGTDAGPSYLSPDEPEKRPDVIRRISSKHPRDQRSPFHDVNGVPMKPLARLHISRRRLYQKNCENEQSGTEPMECATHPWGKWSECSSKCGGGKRYRTRTFKYPGVAHQFPCKNILREEEDCMGKKCREDENVAEDLNCRLSEWSDWSSCSSACGKGTRTRTRKFLNPKNRKKCQVNNYPKLQEDEECEGENCSGDIVEEVEMPAECQTTGWSDWTPCSAKCGKGKMSRQREIWNVNSHRDPSVPDPCDAVKRFEQVNCTDNNCDTRPEFCNYEPTVGPCRDNKRNLYWYYDSIKKTCAIFYAASCNTDENKFTTREECKSTCEERPEVNSLTIENLRREGYYEKVDCRVSEWNIRPCNATCGEGYQIKTREVTRSPKNGGKPCPKKMVRLEKCFVRCPYEISESYRRRSPISMAYTMEGINEVEEKCRYSEWSPWTPCTASCGDNSYRQKTRSLRNTELSHKCTDRVRIEKCDVLPCHVYNTCRRPPCD